MTMVSLSLYAFRIQGSLDQPTVSDLPANMCRHIHTQGSYNFALSRVANNLRVTVMLKITTTDFPRVPKLFYQLPQLH